MTRFGKNAKGDTSLGGAPAAFPRTTWGLISRVRDPQTTDQHRADFEDLCRRYWKPVYRYVRIAWAKSNEDAKDLTQAFFLWLLDGEALRKYAPERGSFRRYLKVVMGSFVNDQEKALNRLKRGGGVKIVPMDAGDLPLDEMLPDPQSADPEKAFDRAWALAVAKNAIDRVRVRYAAEGRDVQFRVYEIHDLAPGGAPPSYEEVARTLGLKEGDVRNYLSWVRVAVRDEVKAELASLMTDSGDLQEEWNALFGS